MLTAWLILIFRWCSAARRGKAVEGDQRRTPSTDGAAGLPARSHGRHAQNSGTRKCQQSRCAGKKPHLYPILFLASICLSVQTGICQFTAQNIVYSYFQLKCFILFVQTGIWQLQHRTLCTVIFSWNVLYYLFRQVYDSYNTEHCVQLLIFSWNVLYYLFRQIYDSYNTEHCVQLFSAEMFYIICSDRYMTVTTQNIVYSYFQLKCFILFVQTGIWQLQHRTLCTVTHF